MSNDNCILDILNIPKPLKESCFSEKQINLLYDAWRSFMYEHFRGSPEEALQDVNMLYSSAVSTKQKYDTLRFNSLSGIPEYSQASSSRSMLRRSATVALNIHESEWVMDDTLKTTSPFILYLRNNPDIMSELRMSFKPRLLHHGPLEISDIISVLLRYVYWFKTDDKHSVNLLTVTDQLYFNEDNSMIQSLVQNWSEARFHVALLYETHWTCVVIDKVHGTFDYFDPLGQPLDMNDETSALATYVVQLFNTAVQLSDKIKSQRDLLAQTLTTIRRGFNHQQHTKKSNCAMFVLLFVHLQVVEHQTMEQISKLDFSMEKCEALRPKFFVIPKESEETNQVINMRYGAYDVRLAALNFKTYVEQILIQLVKDNAAKVAIQNRIVRLKHLITEPGDYRHIRFTCNELQSDLIKFLPDSFISYNGTNLWIPFLNQVVNDPLTKKLRGSSKPGKHKSRNTVRRGIGEEIFNSLMEWTKSPENVSATNSINNVLHYVILNYNQVLNFDLPAKPVFVNEFSLAPLGFIEEAFRRQETTSFGVQLLRQMNDIIRVHFVGISIKSVLDEYKEPEVYKLEKPEEMEKIEQVMTSCDNALKRAYEIIKETVYDTMTLQRRNGLDILPLGNNMYEVSKTLSQPSIQDLLNRIQQSSRFSFYSNEQVTPWNFPLILTKFYSTYNVEPLQVPSIFSEYLISNELFNELTRNQTFLNLYIRGLEKIKWSELSDTSLTLVVESIFQITSALKQQTSTTQYTTTITSVVTRNIFPYLHNKTVHISNLSTITARLQQIVV